MYNICFDIYNENQSSGIILLDIWFIKIRKILAIGCNDSALKMDETSLVEETKG